MFAWLLACRVPSSAVVSPPAENVAAAAAEEEPGPPEPEPADEAPGEVVDASPTETEAPADPPLSAEPEAEPEAEPTPGPRPGEVVGGGTGEIGLGNSCKIGACDRRKKWRTRVRITKLSSQGELETEVIRRMLGAHDRPLTSCYWHGLDKDPRVAGTVELHFVIAINPGRSGAWPRLVEGTGRSSPGLADVEECMIRRVKNVHFPRPVGGGEVDVTVQYKLSRVR